MTMRTCVCGWLSLLYLSGSVQGWMLPSPLMVRSPRLSSSTVVSMSAQDGDEENLRNNNNNDDADQIRRMALVRSLQMSFYKGNTTHPPSLDESKGVFRNLPLWRVPWTELPGRSNVLHVHEPMYTNMFESILHQPRENWYVGHLHLPGGTKNIKSLELHTWKEEADFKRDHPRSAVVGTLMRIVDYRRIDDGRLLILVQSLERFVVTHIQQQLPYSVADVQLWPDQEEVALLGDSAIQESIRYRDYECDPQTRLPLPDRPDMNVQDVWGPKLAEVLPFVPFAKDLQIPESKQQQQQQQQDDPQDQATTTNLTVDRLLESDVLHHPPSTQCPNDNVDDLERSLWLSINQYLISTRLPVNPALLSLVPARDDWPRTFVLKKITSELAKRTDIPHSYVTLSPSYPGYRRQRRLSYSAAALLERGMEDTTNTLRQQLLETSSTRERLCFVLEQFQLANEGLVDEEGDFQ